MSEPAKRLDPGADVADDDPVALDAARLAALEAAIDHAAARRPTPAVDYEPPAHVAPSFDLGTAMREAAMAMGLDAPTPHVGGRPRWCAGVGCGKVVPPGEGSQVGSTVRCAACVVKAKVEGRRARLAPARETLPQSFEWARVETENGHLVGPLVDLVGREHVNKARGWFAARDKRTLTVQGETGTGKTSLAVALVRRLLDKAEALDADADLVELAVGARYIPALKLARARETHPLGRGESPLADLAMRASLLLLDDLGAEGKTLSDVIGNVLHDRYDTGKLTIVTTWLGEQEIEARYGVGLRRRVLTDATQILLRGKPKDPPDPPKPAALSR